MFKQSPNIFAHASALKNGSFVVEDGIIFKNDDQYTLKSRECPHRGYVMHAPGDIVKNVVCKLHGFAWDNHGKPLSQEPHCNHFYKLADKGNLELGKTGLLFENFNDANDDEWIKDLGKQTDLEFDKTIRGESAGSCLWIMETLTDLIHIRQNGIHPRQSLETPLSPETFNLSEGDNYVVQQYKNINGNSGYWVFIYPGFGVEFEPGKLLITRITPKHKNKEFEYYWEMQLYYAPGVDSTARAEWEKCIDVFKEDVEAVERIRKPFFPLKRTVNAWENQTKHWGNWYSKNLKKD